MAIQNVGIGPPQVFMQGLPQGQNIGPQAQSIPPPASQPLPQVQLGNNPMQPQVINQQQAGVQAPPTGLIGSELALNQGQAGAIGAINTGTQTARTDINNAMIGLDQNNAAKMQADLTGSNGPAAQAAAQQLIQQSPAAKYQFDQMQRATERSAAARGGLLGGNVALELQRNAAGIASQDYQNQFANLGQVADRTLNQNVVKAGLAKDLASTAQSAGIQTAGIMGSTAGQIAQGRSAAGYAIAQNASQAASNISSLLSQQGIAVSDMMAKDISTVTDMIYQSGVQDALDSKALAAILANIAGGQASTVQQGNAAIGEANAAGTLGVANAIQSGIQQGASIYSPKATVPTQNIQLGNGNAYAGYA
jgi:hypothetical protein